MFVSEFSIWVTNAKQRYLDAKKVLENSKNDPPNNPYRSKYEARDILAQIALEIDKNWKSINSLQTRLISILVKYELGVIGIETDECSTGCEILTTILEEIREIAEKSECCCLAISILNQLGILWSERGEIEKALNYLLEAETIYNNYKSGGKTCPFKFEDIFTMEINEEDWTSFEKTYTHTLYYLAQVYGHLNDNCKSATYCRETLKRQRDSGDFETNDWSMNCATLSQYYIQEKLFGEARHLLSCAAYVLFKYEVKVEKDIEENKEAWTEVHQSKASLSCCWIKYSINVLAESLNSEENENDNDNFTRLIEDEEVFKMEKRVPYHIINYDEARSLFLFAQNHVTVAKSYFTLNEFANNCTQIIQDHSKLFKNLALYDSDWSRQCKMHKRRLDMLEEVLGKLNPQFYLSVCRQLQFELGEICHEMIDLKTKIANATPEGLTSCRAKKMNSLALKGITHFQNFIDSLKDKDGKLPDFFPDDIVRPALIAHFYIGRYYSKLIENDANKKLHNLSKTEEYYSFIVKYAEANKQHANCVEKEFPVIKEMLELMAEKKNQITGSTMF